MSLLPDDSFKHLLNVRKEFDRMFSAFPFDFSYFDNMLGNFGGMTVNVHETATEVIATCGIPGLEKEDDIQINVEHNMLSIRGSINTTTEIKEGNMYRQEHYASGFQRSVFLPSPVSKDGVKATYRNGVLEVRMQKTAQTNVQNIDIDFY
jgi:HSP20 family protein